MTIATLVTGVIGPVGKYIADLLTDCRRKNEKHRAVDDDCIRLNDEMPDLLVEMRQDLAAQPLCREFILLSKG